MAFFVCSFCFPISGHMMSSWKFFFCLFISYAYICTCIRLFPTVASRVLKRENKTSDLKRSISCNFHSYLVLVFMKALTLTHSSSECRITGYV